jgi:hypothetical protein
MTVLLMPREPRHLGRAVCSVAKQNCRHLLYELESVLWYQLYTGDVCGVVERMDEKTVKKLGG